MIQKLFEYKPLDVVELSTETIDGKRHYVVPTGEKYPSVTTVLSKLSEPHIREWREKVGEEEANKISKRAANRGTKVHEIAEKYMQGDKTFLDGHNPLSVSMFADIKPIIDNNITEVYGNEFPLYSHELRTAGRCDLVCSFQNIPTIADFKTSTKYKREEWITGYFIQCTCYAMMVEERYGLHIPQIAVIIAVENDNPQLFVKKTESYTDQVVQLFKYGRIL